jgi:hypothetical protein
MTCSGNAESQRKQICILPLFKTGDKKKQTPCLKFEAINLRLRRIETAAWKGGSFKSSGIKNVVHRSFWRQESQPTASCQIGYPPKVG